MRLDRFDTTIMHQISLSEEGMSAYDLSKIFGEWKRQTIRHRLKRLKKAGLLEKNDTKYELKDDSMIYKGRIIEIRKSSVNIYYCPFKCDLFPECGKESCKFLERLPKFKLSKKGTKEKGEKDTFDISDQTGKRKVSVQKT